MPFLCHLWRCAPDALLSRAASLRSAQNLPAWLITSEAASDKTTTWRIATLSGSFLSLFLLADCSLTTFSPSGKLAQIEYALAAVGQGLPSLGIRCSNGVVLASEKPHPSILSDQSSFEKISRITPDAGVVYSGMGPDSRVLVDKARKGAHAVLHFSSPQLTIELFEDLQ